MTMMAAMTARTTTTADTMMAVRTPVDRPDPPLEGLGDTAVLSGGAGDADADGDRLNDGDCAHGTSVNRGRREDEGVCAGYKYTGDSSPPTPRHTRAHTH